jgi:hypothetical protein
MAKMKGGRPEPGVNQGLMERLAKLQDDMMQAQEALGEERITVTAGGDAVKVVIDGRQRLHSVEIKPEALGERELLQDMLVVAINNALEQSQTLAAQRLQGLSGGLGLPGM